MTPISFQDAYEQTNPNLSDEQRGQSAQAIMAGVAANEQYWNSRGDLEALRAQAEGHGVVVRGQDEEESPTQLGGGTASAPAIDSTAVEDRPAVGAAPGTADVTAPEGASAGSPLDAETVPPEEQGAQLPPAPDNPMDAVARLRAQLRDHGINPEA